MAIVNKFNVNKQEVRLDADIIENMSANDVSYNDSSQYDKNTVGDKLSKLEKEVIYDVSAHNNGTTFPSLSALLSDENLSTLIPSTVRCGGMSIRFVQSSDNNYVQYRLAASGWSTDIHDWTSEDPYFIDKIIQEVNEAIDENTPIEIHGDVTNAPDEEDLTSVNVDGTDVLKFKDKVYNSLTYSGMGKKILRKNIVDGMNTLIQSMINQPNTIYVIQYDFILGEDITIPDNCVLEFDGGSLKNGTLVGNRTMIKCTLYSIFDNIHIDGSWLVPNIYSEWFVDIHEENKINELINLCNTAIYNTVYIADTENPYIVSVKVNRGAGLIVNKANTEIILEGTIKMLPNRFPTQYCVFISESNISVNGGGKIIGDKDEHDYTTISGSHEYGHGIFISGQKTSWSDKEVIYNISICNIEISNCAGDCICFGHAQKMNINNVYLHDARRQGISGSDYSGEIYITNFKITDIHGTPPSGGIDLELNNDPRFYGRNYVIENGYISDCKLGICVSKNNSHIESTNNNASIKNITFVNNDEEFTDCFIDGCLLFANNSNVNVQNIVCTKENVQFFECRSSKNIIISNAIGGHIKITGISSSITFNNSSFSSNSSILINDGSFSLDSGQSLNIVFNNCSLLSTNYHFCSSGNPNNKHIQFNNCDIDAETLVVMSKNALYFYRCNISLTRTKTSEFHDCNIKVVTEYDNPFMDISSYNSKFDITLNCPSSSNYPHSIGVPFNFNLSNIVFKNNIVTIKSDLTNDLHSLFNIGGYETHPFTDIKIVNNKFILDIDNKIKLATVYRAFINPNSGIVVSNYGIYNNQGGSTSRPNLKLILNNRLSYPGVGVIGFKYYDTTLNKSITWNGTNWVDELNNIVTYPITFNLTNIKSNNFVTPDKESQYTFKLEAYPDCTLPSNITVKMGESILTSGTDYTYDSSTGDVVILGTGGSGGVTDALTITANSITA